MTFTKGRWLFATFATLTALLLIPERSADAFCGFYVGGAGAKLFNDATVVVLMREGTRTVLSMQNAYSGPPEKFAMVVPVPVVLQEGSVKTLSKDLFDRIDQLASPRLVEYWEQDPCGQPTEVSLGSVGAMAPPMARAEMASEAKADLGVKVEAKFEVGEYQVVILSAQDSGGLETWLHREGYNIPPGGEPYFRPYVLAGSKFFVAKVDVTKVKFEKGVAALSPLRFHYDSEEFRLPVRLGLINSSGTQDLIVHILGRGTRYELANYPNVTIPTNLDVSETASSQFGAFYTALFDRTVEKNPKAAVTEYAWEPTSCDPCPGPPLDFGALATFGVDVLPSSAPPPAPSPGPRGLNGPSSTSQGDSIYPTKPAPFVMPPAPFVLTRLHLRYTKESLGEDLVFRAAKPIVGGRETRVADGKLENGATPSGFNNFQARYAIRHPWAGPIDCKEPKRGIWGGDPKGSGQKTTSAAKLGLVPRTRSGLGAFLKQDIPEIGVKADPVKRGCQGCAVTERGTPAGAWLGALGALGAVLRRRGARRAAIHSKSS